MRLAATGANVRLNQIDEERKKLLSFLGADRAVTPKEKQKLRQEIGIRMLALGIPMDRVPDADRAVTRIFRRIIAARKKPVGRKLITGRPQRRN